MSPQPVPKNSHVLVTGINGLVASHVGDQLLASGFKARGTARDKPKGEMMTEVYEKRHGAGRFEFVVVPDLGADHAFDEAVQGVYYSNCSDYCTLNFTATCSSLETFT